MSAARPIGIVGYGAIGSRMARRLMAAGFPVLSFDIDPKRQEEARRDGIQPLDDAAAVGRECDVVITCVTDAEAVLDCVAGPAGLAQTLAPGALVIETTTSTPGATRQAAAVLATRRASLIDAPVSRGVPAAENGTLSIMIGGRDEDIARAEPVLGHLGTDLIRTGRTGTGHIAKAMNMMVMAVNLVAVAEVISLGVRLGLERARLVADLNNSPAGSFMTSNHYVKYVLSESYASTFTLDLMLKDLRVATAIAGEFDVPVLLGSRAEQLYVMAASRELETRDNMRIVPFLEAVAGADAPRAAPPDDAAGALAGMLQTAALLGTLEAAVVGREAGLDPDRLLQVLNLSSGASVMSRALAGEPGAVLPTLVELAASTDRAVELARNRKHPLPLCSSLLDVLGLMQAGGKSPAGSAAWVEDFAELLRGPADA